jgi:hypothetical protein
MPTIRRARVLWAASLGLAMSALAGCQTWMGGMTLPSGHYLEHLPQYFPEEPDFPLPKELAYQEEAAGLLAPQNRGPAANGVNPVPPGGGVAPPLGGGAAPPVGGGVPAPPPR